MNKATVAILALGLGLASMTVQPPGQAFAQDQPIYGSQLMTEQERLEYQERMRAATTAQEREQISLEHHARMQDRAREMGVELPDEPPAIGMGGQGMRPRQGMGQGGGMGPGSGMGSGDDVPPRGGRGGRGG